MDPSAGMMGVNLLVAWVLVLGMMPWPGAMGLQPLPAIAVVADQAETDFPEAIHFHLEVRSQSPLESIELMYGVQQTACADASGRARPEVPEPAGDGTTVTVDWTWDLRRRGSLAPGARVWWRWRVATTEGQALTTDEQWLSFDDDTHDWQSTAAGQITVHWYEGDEAFARTMLQAAVDAQARLTADANANLEQPVRVYFYGTSEDLQASLLFPMDWTGGVAFPELYTILIAAGPDDQDYGRHTVAHELMHLVVNQLAFNCWGSIPGWLSEGLASWAEGEADPSQQAALEEAIAGDELLSLRSLGGSFSAHGTRAHLAYAESVSVVTFLLDEYGRERMMELLGVFREGASHDEALERVYGLDTDGLEDAWRAAIGAAARPASATPAGGEGGSVTAVPTLALWSGEPTAQPVTITATVGGGATATASAPARTAVAQVSPSPTVPATRALPTPIGGRETPGDGGGVPWGAIGGGAVLVVGAAAVVVWRARRQGARRNRQDLRQD